MTENERPLPRPPKTPFGRRQAGPEEGGQELIADRMAEAAALGKLDEYLEQELPDNEQARALAKMMMGMTGMMPGGEPAVAPAEENTAGTEAERTAPPPELLQAVQGGDVKGLMDLLKREHAKRSPDGATAASPAEQEAPAAPPPGQPAATIDRELIDALITIASDNSVTLDWIILRAIKVYVEEHRKTGRL